MALNKMNNKSSILKIVELVIGIIMLTLDYSSNESGYISNIRGSFSRFILCAIVIALSVTAMLIVAILVLGFENNSSFELLFNIVACVLLIIAGVAMLVKSQDEFYTDRDNTVLIINGVLGLLNAALYAFGAFLAAGY